jgi:hypothetical protein
LDYSKATDAELNEKIEALQYALGASLGRPFDGREERKNADLLSQIEEVKAEQSRRNLDQT